MKHTDPNDPYSPGKLLGYAALAVLGMTVMAIPRCVYAAPSINVTPRPDGGYTLTIDASEDLGAGCVLRTSGMEAAAIFYDYVTSLYARLKPSNGGMTSEEYVTKMTDALVRDGIFDAARAKRFAERGVALCRGSKI